MRSLWAGLLVVTACVPGLAAETVRKEPRCRLYERHVPGPDVAFQPGRDVHGRPVAGADLPGSAEVGLPASIDFTLSLSPLKYGEPLQGRRLSKALEDTSMPLGAVHIDAADGTVTYDGRPMGSKEGDPTVACR